MPISMSIKLPYKKINKKTINKFYILATNLMTLHGINDYNQIIQQVSVNNDKSIIFDFSSFDDLNKEILLKERITSIIYTFYTARNDSIINKLTFSHFINEFTLLEVETHEKAFTEQILLEFKNQFKNNHQLVQGKNSISYVSILPTHNMKVLDTNNKSKTKSSKWFQIISTTITLLAGIATIIELFL
ncbi:hypothetical protein SAMN04488688_10883 [Paenibacillus sp. cl141a]|uniref:hypothetical protein n=1 Tax=Paenibacillus sp. cl141a TaxID=1761877 RepID=UPI0008B88711|nr:hypothetical protein [Paenibacillus sp. cl141a]SEM04681.1 hypothetical protein SAMN04488688_10883 [Paenibacillus sp. cl141a]